MRFALFAALAALVCAAQSNAAVVYQKTFSAVGREEIWEWEDVSVGVLAVPGDYTITVEAQGALERLDGSYGIYRTHEYSCRSGPEEPWRHCGGMAYGSETIFAGGAVQTMTSAFTILPTSEIEVGNLRETDSYAMRYYVIDYDLGDNRPTTITVTIADAAAVPEPRMWAMLIAGFGLTGVALRRRRDDAAAVTA